MTSVGHSLSYISIVQDQISFRFRGDPIAIPIGHAHSYPLLLPPLLPAPPPWFSCGSCRWLLRRHCRSRLGWPPSPLLRCRDRRRRDRLLQHQHRMGRGRCYCCFLFHLLFLPPRRGPPLPRPPTDSSSSRISQIVVQVQPLLRKGPPQIGPRRCQPLRLGRGRGLRGGEGGRGGAPVVPGDGHQPGEAVALSLASACHREH